MIYERKSKKGFTLVELVVTIAILGIVSGMGVGIVANTIKNYAVASTTVKEQEIAIQIEGFITRYARTATDVDVVDSSTVPANNVNAEYISTSTAASPSPSKSRIYLTTNKVETIGSADVSSSQSYDGVSRITFRMRKQKDDPDDSFSRCQACLDYTIEMNDYYTLKGTVVMNNVREDTVIGMVGNTFTEAKSDIVLDFSSGTETKALVFKR